MPWSILIPLGIASVLACGLVFVIVCGKQVEDDTDFCGWYDTRDDSPDYGFGEMPSPVEKIGVGASFGPGSHPTGHAASGVDGASRFDPSRGGSAHLTNRR